MTASEESRLSVVERRMDDLCARFERVEEKLDRALESKADKSDVDVLRNRMWALMVSTAGAAILALVGIGVYLLQSHIIAP